MSTIDADMRRTRLSRAVQSVDAAIAELGPRTNITGLERLREDLRAAIRACEDGFPAHLTRSGQALTRV